MIPLRVARCNGPDEQSDARPEPRQQRVCHGRLLQGRRNHLWQVRQPILCCLYASASLAAKTGNTERAQDLYANPKLRLRPLYQAGDKQTAKINQQIKRVSNSTTLSSADKNDRIETLIRLRNSLAMRVDQMARAAEN